MYYLNFVLEGSAMSSCDYLNPFRVSIFKNKNLEFPWFDFANFWVDARSNTYLSFKLSEPIRTSYCFRDMRLRNLPIIFRTGNLVCLVYRVNFPNFSCILVKNFVALVLSCAINAFTAEKLP